MARGCLSALSSSAMRALSCKEDELLGRLQKRTGRTQEELRREIESY